MNYKFFLWILYQLHYILSKQFFMEFTESVDHRVGFVLHAVVQPVYGKTKTQDSFPFHGSEFQNSLQPGLHRLYRTVGINDLIGVFCHYFFDQRGTVLIMIVERIPVNSAFCHERFYRYLTERHVLKYIQESILLFSFVVVLHYDF